MRKRLARLLYLVLFISSCTSEHLPAQQSLATGAIVDTTTLVITKTSGLVTVTPQPSSTPIRTVIPSGMLSATSTVTTAAGTAMPKPSLTPTGTALPTLPAIEVEQVVEKLISANGYCKLPCVGGFKPGETSYAASKFFFSQVAEQVKCYVDGSCWITYHRSNRYPFIHRGIDIRLYRSEPLADDLAAIITGWYHYQVTDFLEDYGKPEQIYLRLNQYEPIEPRNGFDLLLFYPSQGFLAAYEGTTGTGKHLNICPVKSIPWQSIVPLLVWNPGEQLPFEKIVTKYGFISRNSVNDFRPLEDYGETTVDMFYEQFNQPRNQGACFEVDTPWYQEH